MTIDYDTKKVQHFPIGDNDIYGGEVCQIMGTPDSDFVLLGVPSTSSFCVFNFDKYKSSLSLQKRIHVDGFRTFEMDRYATQLVFLNQRCRQLEFYSLKWDFEFKGTAKKDMETVEDAQLEERITDFIPTALLKQAKIEKPTTRAPDGDLLTAGDTHGHKTACCAMF